MGYLPVTAIFQIQFWSAGIRLFIHTMITGRAILTSSFLQDLPTTALKNPVRQGMDPERSVPTVLWVHKFYRIELGTLVQQETEVPM